MISKNLSLATPILKITSDLNTHQKLPRSKSDGSVVKHSDGLACCF